MKQSRQFLFIPTDEVRVLHGGADYFQQMENLIHASKRIIHLQVYILDEDETGVRILQALELAASRGVQVYLMADGYASQQISEKTRRAMKNAGIRFKYFEPLFKSAGFYFGRRMHHKIFVSDDSWALVGGINISNRYNDINGKKGWLDFAVLLHGSICSEIAILCYKTWNGFKLTPTLYHPALSDTIIYNKQILTRMRRNDWVRRKNQISGSYVDMIRAANEEIIILCSYFLPGRIIRKQLTIAARRGIKVKLILAGFSDVKIAKYAERFMYDWLLRKGIEIYEYKPNVLHGKVAIFDRKFITLGSYNVNDISAYASIELNIDISDTTIASALRYDIENVMKKDCEKITFTGKRYNENYLQQFLSWLSFHTIRIVFFLFTFYFKKQR